MSHSDFSLCYLYFVVGGLNMIADWWQPILVCASFSKIECITVLPVSIFPILFQVIVLLIGISVGVAVNILCLLRYVFYGNIRV